MEVFHGHRTGYERDKQEEPQGLNWYVWPGECT